MFAEAVMKGLKEDAFEIGCGMAEGLIRAPREGLDEIFRRMNDRW